MLDQTDITFRLKVSMLSDSRFLPVVRTAVGRLATTLGCSESDSRALTLGIDEALTNVIRHAYGSKSNQPIEFLCQASGTGLEFRITDHGAPPDRDKICARPPSAAEPGGRGTHIIRAVMDEVVYTTTPAGNQLALKKNLLLDKIQQGPETKS